MGQPRARYCEDGLGNCRRYHRGCRFTKAHRNLGTIDKADVEHGHIADPRGRIGVQVGIAHLARYELRPLMQRHTKTLKHRPLGLRPG